MLYIDKERGRDSTGVFTVLNSGVCMVAKEASTPEQFMYSKDAEELFQKAYGTGSCLVGHNRSATRGSVSDENAHPFNQGDIVLVHNGTLTNHKAISKTEVDSDAIAEALNNYQGDNLGDVFGKLYGAYSCIWYDNRDQSLNFFRNSQRPMWLYEDDNITYFASEPVMIMYALIRENIKWDKDKCFELPVHHHLKYVLQKGGGMKKHAEPQEVVVNPTKELPHTPVASMAHGETTNIVLIDGHISLNKRKLMRKAVQNFLTKNKVGTEVNFIADDYTDVGGKWTLFGTIEGAPPFVTATMPLGEGWSEDKIVELCDSYNMSIPVLLCGYDLDHKKCVFQINTEIVDEALHLDSATTGADSDSFATATIQ